MIAYLATSIGKGAVLGKKHVTNYMNNKQWNGYSEHGLTIELTSFTQN
jgi:hypothetical protein